MKYEIFMQMGKTPGYWNFIKVLGLVGIIDQINIMRLV